MPAFVPQIYSKEDIAHILNGYKNGNIPKADLPVGIFRGDVESLIATGIYWEEWDRSYYTELFRNLKEMAVNERIDIIRGKKYISWGNVNYVKLANVFFPHMIEARSNDKPSVKDVWNDKEKMTKLLDKFLNDKKIFKKHEKTMKFFRKFIRSLSGGYFTYNYKPDIAKVIYETYGQFGKVFDFSMGWGGRLVGFLASNSMEYVGVEVNKKNFASYDSIAKAYNNSNSLMKKRTKFVECPAEDFCPPEYEGYFDLSFSSPPYFTKEIYSDDPNQHHIKHGSSYNVWLDGFLRPAIKNTHFMLKPKGKFIINIADVIIGGETYPLENDTIKIAQEQGFVLDEILYMKLNKSPFLRYRDVSERVINDNGFKWERMFVFKKG